MLNSAPIVIIDDDKDDQELAIAAFKDLNTCNDLIFFENGEEALKFLRTSAVQPFLILCDINLPRINGLSLKKIIDSDPELRRKSIPFIFLSTTSVKELVNKAYHEMTVQGYFQKGATMQEIINTYRVIIDYWKLCKHPNTI